MQNVCNHRRKKIQRTSRSKFPFVIFVSVTLGPWNECLSLLLTNRMLVASPCRRFECFCVLDLNKLTTSQLSRRALAIIKEQAAIDSVCFPETMSKMLIVNAPTYFSATWGIIKGWLDARTAAKIEVISSRSTMEKRLLEFIDADQLPKDYGGTGPDTNDSMNEGITGDFSRLETHMLYLRYVSLCYLRYVWTPLPLLPLLIFFSCVCARYA